MPNLNLRSSRLSRKRKSCTCSNLSCCGATGSPPAKALTNADKTLRHFKIPASFSKVRHVWAFARRYSFGVRPRSGGALNPEVLTCLPPCALFMHRLAHWLWGHRLRWLARFLRIYPFFTGIDSSRRNHGAAFSYDHGMGVVIGETAVIGNDVTLYHGVTLGGTSWNKGKRHPTLETGW